MKKIILGVVLLGVALVLILQTSKEKSVTGSDGDDDQVQDVSVLPQKNSAVDEVPSAVESEKSAVAEDESASTAESAEGRIFREQMTKLSKCLQVPAVVQDGDSGMTYFSLNETLQGSIGSSVSEIEVWNSVDIRTPQGELRRIVIENNGGDSGHGKTLQYFRVAQNEALQELPLSEEQSLNPSESLIATLESDGRVESRTLSRQIFYDGTVMHLLEKDGKLQSYEVRKDGKVFLCRDDHECLCE